MASVDLNDLAPTGMLRVGINFGNTVLTKRGSDGSASGIAVDLAQALADRAGVALNLVSYDSAGRMAEAARHNAWDVAFLAFDPARSEHILFTTPYLEIDTTCLVWSDSSTIRGIDEVDREGVRVAVSTGSAYDLSLTRSLKHAQLVRAPSPNAAVQLFVENKADVLAGIRPMLEDTARTLSGTSVLDGRFSTVQQAIGTPRGRDSVFAYLQTFLEEIKTSSLLMKILRKNGVTGVSLVN